MGLLPGRSLLFALAAGAAGGVVATLLKQNGDSTRPAMKSAIRAGLLMLDQARQTFGEMAETATDLLAEAQAELEAERQKEESPRAPPNDHVAPFKGRAAPEGERKAHG